MFRSASSSTGGSARPWRWCCSSSPPACSLPSSASPRPSVCGRAWVDQPERRGVAWADQRERRALTNRARALRLEAAGPLGRRHPALIAFALATVVFLAAPLAVVVPISFSSAKYLTFPPPGWSLQWYARYFGSREWMSATVRSFEVAVLTTAAATAVGTAAALALRRPFRGRSLVRLIVLAPLVVPVIIVAIAIYGLYAQWKLVGTLAGLVLAHTVLALPFVVVIVSATLHGIDETLELAAQNLGANRWHTFRLVTLPLIRP